MSKVRYSIFMFASSLIATAQSTDTIPTDSLTRALDEIVVTADQPTTRLVGNTLVSIIPGTPLADLGNALDVLDQLSMISVADGAVTVSGKGAPLIYIDNRPADDSFDLRSLRSRNIRRVELILNPGAEYAGATGAVLKITTRRLFVEGLTLEGETQGKIARSATGYELLTLRYFLKNGSEFFATGLAAHNNNIMRGNTVNTIQYDGHPAIIGSSQDSKSPSNNVSAKFGFNKSSGVRSLGAYYRVLHENGNFLTRGSEWLDDELPVGRDISNRIIATNHYGQIYYDNMFSDKFHLHFDGTFVNRNSHAARLTAYADQNIHPDVAATEKRHALLYGGRVTASYPLSAGKFTVGSEDSYTSTRLDYRMLNEAIGSYIPSSLSDVSQTSVAGFASYNRRFGRLDISAGLRYEYKNFTYRLDGKKDHDLSRKDNLLTPDISVTYGLNDNATSMLSLAYKSFTELPSYSQLTGGLNYTGRHEIEGGNPALRDGRSHQLTLMGMAGDFILQAVFRRSLDSYGFIKRVYPADDLQLIFQPINFNVSCAWLYFVWQRNIRNWQPSVTLGSMPQWLKIAGERYDTPIFEWYFDNTFRLPFNMTAIVNVYGKTAGYMQTQRFSSKPFMMDASVQKSFLNRSLNVKLSANNRFNSHRDGWWLKSYGVGVKKSQSYESRFIALTLSYTFQPRKTGYKGEEAASSEAKRL